MRLWDILVSLSAMKLISWQNTELSMTRYPTVKLTRQNSLFHSLLALSFLGGWILAMPARGIAQAPAPAQVAAQPSSQLTEEKIRQTMAAIEEAEKSEDIEGLLKFLAPFAISEVIVESQGRSVTTSVEGIEAHRNLLKKTFELVKQRNPIEQYTSIRITSDGQLGIVTRIAFEELISADGRQFFASSTDTFRLAWLGEQPTIVSTKSQGWLEERPRQ